MGNFPESWGRCTLSWCLMTVLTLWSSSLWAQLDAPVVQSSTAAATLSLKDLVSQVREANKDIRTKRAEKGIAATGIERASAAFQPVATVSATDGRNRQPNTYEEALTRGQASYYSRDGQDYTAGVSQLLPTGAKLEAKTTLSSFITNINQMAVDRPEGAKDNRSFWGVTLTQPLAKDGGVTVTQARARVAELDLAVAEHTEGETESSIVAEASLAYYELVLAQHRVTAAQGKILTGQRLLIEARALAHQGRLPESDVWEVENALSRFQAGLSEALQGERERLNRLKTLVMVASGSALQAWRASDALPIVSRQDPGVGAGESVRLAMDSRHDFLMQKKLLEREGVQLVYAQNQALPHIDLVASYGRNGLAYSASTAFGARNYPTWSVGLQMQIPLGTNRQGGADIAAANLRRENALLAIKALEVQIANDIDTSLNMRASAAERWIHWQDVARRELQQLELERKRFSAGRSEMREILLREEKVVNSRLMVLEQQVAFAKAQVILESAQGILLKRWTL